MTADASNEQIVRDDSTIDACFPLQFHVDLLRRLRDRSSEIEIITYADLPFEDDFEVERNYPGEFGRWQQQLKRGDRDPHKIHVLLQHDVDDFPQRTHAILEHEQQLGIRSNIMIFNRRLNRKRLQLTGELEQREYPVDDDLLRRAQAGGCVIGYHSNAYEWARFDANAAVEIFERDVAELRTRFDIRFFCPHGGVRDSRGQSNASLDIPPSLSRSIRWVLNRHTVRFDGTYSDGGINSPRLDASAKDLRAFMQTWQPGKRYRILTHPQYYDASYTRLPRLAGVAWYEEILRCDVAGTSHFEQ